MRGVVRKAAGVFLQLIDLIVPTRFAIGARLLKCCPFQIFVDDCAAENLRLAKQLLQLKDEVASIVNM